MTDTNTRLKEAMRHISSGNLSKAEDLCRQVLKTDSQQPQALHFLGVIAFKSQSYQAAIDLISKSLEIDPLNADAFSNLGLAYQALGLLDEAIQNYKKATSIGCDDAQVYFNLGTALQFQNKLEDAVSRYQKALEISPDFTQALYNLGNIMRIQNRPSDAVEYFQRARSLQPKNERIAANLGFSLHDTGQLDEAFERFQESLSINPNQAAAHVGLGVINQDRGDLQNAIASFKKALSIDPEFNDAHVALGLSYQRVGRLDEALSCYLRALQLNPNSAQVQNYRGTVLREQGDLEGAAKSYRNALSINPDYAEAYNNLGNTLRALGAVREAISSFEKSLKLNPENPKAHSNLLLSKQYEPGTTLEAIKSSHLAWDRYYGAPLRKGWLNHKNIKDPEKLLRIGLVSPDLGTHPVGFFLVNLLKFKPENKLHLICYSDRIPDDLTLTLKNLSNGWVDIRGLTDDVICKRIRSDEIDILIDLAGHTAKNRLLVFARKPSPIQLTWLGYPSSTGISAIDYILADNVVVPKKFEQYYSEKVIALPDGNITYSPPDYAPKISLSPFKKNGFITFGSFNNPAKINEEVLISWAKIIKFVPHSRMIIKYGGMDASGNRERICKYFDKFGVNENRLIVEGKSPHIDLLNRYNEMDIALDTFPYSGGLTTCEALWMGVPVISVPGMTYASRTSSSHLINAGLSELVARDREDYITKSLDLANDTGRLAKYRATLRDKLKTSALCDGKTFAVCFSSVMRQIWRDWCLSNAN